MRAAILAKPGVIRLADHPRNSPNTGEIEIEVKFVGICGSDLARYEGHMPTPEGFVFGHEFSGLISRLGDGVEGFVPDQPVTVAPLLTCGVCQYCRSDKGYLCEKRVRFGTNADGALQEYVNFRSNRVFPLSEKIPLQYGALAEPLAVSIHAIRQAGNVEGKSVLIFGSGAIGLLAGEAARVEGAKRVILIDINAERVAFAKERGFFSINGTQEDPLVRSIELTEGQGADVILEATGSMKVSAVLIPALAKLGKIVIVGLVKEPVPINLMDLLMKEGQIRTSRYFSLMDFQQAINYINDGILDVAPYCQEEISFSKFGEENGSLVMRKGREAIRLFVNMKNSFPEDKP